MNIEIRIAVDHDIDQIIKLEHLISLDLLKEKVKNKEVLICLKDDTVIGVLRFCWLWDMFPFINYLWIVEYYRIKNIGKQLVNHLISLTKEKNSNAIFTSTQVDEDAQHFWRKIGFEDSGGFTFKKEPFELIMIKYLK
jgi:N-acetylglutamate synthase-like GNAT family acetyltransferase